MAAVIEDVLKKMTLFVDGFGMAGKVAELTPPKLTMKTEEFRGGGMDVPVDIEMGMEKLEAAFTLKGYNAEVLKRFGLAPGKQVPLTLRGSLVSQNGRGKPIVVNFAGC
uniref:Phage tail tube protein FII n=1 Tax=Candidatus Kentrum sp. TC TaxID=2126339 RepID=A0A450Z351_9GAMM|nr:MAG: hypothetical protein BECKTC1821E_GA0114239_11055 [Candidatus Kentron sp. TC]VFK50703.1 MAG: hypothetical protein BECKTC1821D_GA0114238_111715 [Candidatus Kentron sp. TC]VFK59839.1 MAG: hypothetical protein BECKTC1821F_GA0114240_10385 [Candidatus Kentron sp. TC]